MDPAVLAILGALEAKRPGTPDRAVAQRAVELGYEIVPPAAGSDATYLRLVRKSPAGRPVTLYLDAVKLGSVAQGQRAFAASVTGAITGTKEVRYPFGSADPFAVVAAFAGWSEAAAVAPAGTVQAPGHLAPPLPAPAPGYAAPPLSPSASRHFAPPLLARQVLPEPVRPSAGIGADRRRWVIRAVVGSVVLLFVIAGQASLGPSGGLVMVGLAALAIGGLAAVVGRARWAFIASRTIGGAVAGAGLVMLVAGQVRSDRCDLRGPGRGWLVLPSARRRPAPGRWRPSGRCGWPAAARSRPAPPPSTSCTV